MLSHISIKNFAIIENAEIDFHEGLNIITGETGSGKSIVMEAEPTQLLSVQVQIKLSFSWQEHTKEKNMSLPEKFLPQERIYAESTVKLSPSAILTCCVKKLLIFTDNMTTSLC